MHTSLLHRFLAFIGAVSMLAAHAIPGKPGTLDGTFFPTSPVGAGKVITSLGDGSENANGLILRRDGKIVLAGECLFANNTMAYKFCAVRYLSNGSLDTTFGVNGKVSTEFLGRTAGAVGIVEQIDERVILGGPCSDSQGAAFCVLRYRQDGTLDESFGTGGMVSHVPAFYNNAQALTLQSDGKIVLAGWCNFQFCAQRYRSDGSVDVGFGFGGLISARFGGYTGSSVTSVVAQVDGRLILAGDCFNGLDHDFCMLRYNADGSPDTSFGINGIVVKAVGNTDITRFTVIQQPDKKIVVAGHCRDGTNNVFCALRYGSDGLADVSFGTNGWAKTTSAFGADRSQAVALQEDGKIVLAGYCYNGYLYDFCALRYRDDGSLDSTFGVGGKIMTTMTGNNGLEQARALAIQPDGKLLLAGVCANGQNYDFCALRYDGGPFGYKNCSLDIDGDGLVLATTDSLMHTRIALGITGPAVVNGITFRPTATRNTWPLIRDYLVTQCGMSLVQ